MKTMKAPDYFLAIWLLRIPSILKFKQIGITLNEGKDILELINGLRNLTLSQIEELAFHIDLLESTSKLAWSLFRIKNQGNEFDAANFLHFNEKEELIEIRENQQLSVMNEIKRLLNK